MLTEAALIEWLRVLVATGPSARRSLRAYVAVTMFHSTNSDYVPWWHF